MSFTVRLDDVAVRPAQQDDQAEEAKELEERIELWAKCSFDEACAARLESWSGTSKPWRNTFLRDATEKCYSSTRYWLAGAAHLRQLNEDSLTAFANSPGLCIEVFAGRKAADEAVALASARISLEGLLQGHRLERQLELHTTDGMEICLRVSVDPDEALVDFAIRGRLLTLEDCTIVSVPRHLVQDWLDTACPATEADATEAGASNLDAAVNASEEAGESGVISQPAYSPEQIEALAVLAVENPRRVVIEVELPSGPPVKSPDTPSEVVDAAAPADAQASGPEAETAEIEDPVESAESGGEENPPEPPHAVAAPIKFLLAPRTVRFDKEAAEWKLDDDEGQPVCPKAFLSVETLERLKLDESIWEACAVRIVRESQPDEEAEKIESGLGEEEKEAVPVQIANLQPLLDPGVPALAASSNDGAVILRLSASKPLIRKHAGAPGDVVPVAALAPTADSAQHGELRACEAARALSLHVAAPNGLPGMPASFSQSLTSEQETRELLRVRLLETLQGATGLRTNAEHETTRQTMELMTQLQARNSLDPTSGDRLRRLAQEAELEGQLARARELWCELATRMDASANFEFAQCVARRGDLGQALELVGRVPLDAPINRARLALDASLARIPASLRSSKRGLLSAPLLLAFLRFELGDEDAITFPDAATSRESDHKADAVEHADGETFLQLAEDLADLKLAEATKKVLMCAHLRFDDSLGNELLVRSEMVRASHKMMTGMAEVAVDILQSACKEGEAISQTEVSEVIRAKAYVLLGTALGLTSEPTKSRSVLSTAMSILNELEERGPGPADKRWIAEVPALRLRILHRLGALTSATGDWRKARVIYRNAVRTTAALGTLGWAWQGLGHACTQLGDYAEADVALRRALIADPGNPVTWGCLAVKHKTDEAAAIPEEIEHATTIALRQGLCSKTLLDQLAGDPRIEDRLSLVANLGLSVKGDTVST